MRSIGQVVQRFPRIGRVHRDRRWFSTFQQPALHRTMAHAHISLSLPPLWKRYGTALHLPIVNVRLAITRGEIRSRLIPCRAVDIIRQRHGLARSTVNRSFHSSRRGREFPHKSRIMAVLGLGSRDGLFTPQTATFGAKPDWPFWEIRLATCAISRHPGLRNRTTDCGSRAALISDIQGTD
jgi:hypothetical protein